MRLPSARARAETPFDHDIRASVSLLREGRKQLTSKKTKNVCVFFARANARQAAAPESRAPGGEARLRLALEGVHPLHRGDVWCEALDADGKRDACSVSYEAYLDRGACDEATATARDDARRDAESAFACHPRFARTTARRAFPYRPPRSPSGSFSSDGGDLHELSDDRSESGSTASSRARSDAGASTSSRASAKLTDYCLLDALERVCAAHAARSPHGHSAAACTVAGVLLLVTEDEEKSFWMLTCFAEDVAPWLFFPCHTGLLTECLAFDEAVARKLPHTAKTCADACVRPSLLCAGWLAKLGANALPGESVSRLWDALVLEGGDVLPRAAAAFLKVEGDAVLAEARRCSTTSNGVSGAALLDAAERAAAAHFETDDVVADAVFQARAARECVEWARAKADAAGRVATRRASVASFARLRLLFSEQEAETKGLVSASVFESLVAASYVDESRSDAAFVADAFEEAGKGASHEKSAGGASFAAWLDACRRSESESLRACARLTDSGSTYANENDALRAFLRGDEEEAEVNDATRLDAPSPARLASATRAARAAFSRGDDAGRTFVCASDASAAALESAMLFGRGGERWLESVRGDARGAVALAAVASAVAAARSTKPLGSSYARLNRRAFFSVSLATTEDIVPSMGHLFAWPPRTPHTQYAALVLAPGRAPRRVVKRYSDFRALHAAAEREGVAAAVGPALALPFAAPGTISWSSDPAVVQARRVQLQRYLDVLHASGCPAAGGLLAAFLRVDEEEAGESDEGEGFSGARTFCPRTLRRRSSLEKRRKVRGVCSLGAMTCGPSAFTGELPPIAAW